MRREMQKDVRKDTHEVMRETCTACDAVRVPCDASMTWVRYGQVVHRVGHGFCGELQCCATTTTGFRGKEMPVAAQSRRECSRRRRHIVPESVGLR